MREIPERRGNGARVFQRRVREKPFVPEELRRDQQRIAGEGRGGAVRRVVRACRMERQDLPQTLAGRSRPVEERHSLVAQVSHAKPPGQGRRVQQEAAASGQIHATTLAK